MRAAQATNTKHSTRPPCLDSTVTHLYSVNLLQANPLGEQYALHKVLHHYHSDLRAVFLYYAQVRVVCA